MRVWAPPCRKPPTPIFRLAGLRLAGLGSVGLLLALGVASCGPLPRPFEHDAPSSLVTDRQIFTPVTIKPVDGAPGLAQAMVAALEREDIAATTEAGGPRYLLLAGFIDRTGARLVWRITTNDGVIVGETSEPFTSSVPGPAGQIAASAAPSIAQLLRGSDAGLADIERTPRVAVHPVQTTSGLDASELTQAMVRALGHQGLIADPDRPTFVVEGTVKITPGGGGQDLVEVAWTVRTPDGKELATVSQGSPVPHQALAGPMGPLARDIAEAGAEGVSEAIQKSRTGRAEPSGAH